MCSGVGVSCDPGALGFPKTPEYGLRLPSICSSTGVPCLRVMTDVLPCSSSASPDLHSQGNACPRTTASQSHCIPPSPLAPPTRHLCQTRLLPSLPLPLQPSTTLLPSTDTGVHTTLGKFTLELFLQSEWFVSETPPTYLQGGDEFVLLFHSVFISQQQR